MPLANIEYVRSGHPDQGLPEGEGPVDPGYGVGIGSPSHPIVLPPLPGVWPPPGKPALPIALPPGVPSHPIYIEGTPEHPIALPPGEVYPPLPPEFAGKAVLIIVVGGGERSVRWYIVPPPSINPAPPVPQPKPGGLR
jgi:hypothetical protein